MPNTVETRSEFRYGTAMAQWRRCESSNGRGFVGKMGIIRFPCDAQGNVYQDVKSCALKQPGKFPLNQPPSSISKKEKIMQKIGATVHG